MVAWLAVPLIVCLLGGVVMLFFRDWVWSIDKHSSHFERDKHGEPIRTEAWDRSHRRLGYVMVGAALVLGALVLLAG